MTEPDAQPSKTRKANCSQCSGERNCDVLGEHKECGGDGFFDWQKDWRILRCRGCDHVFVQTISTNSEDYSNYYGEEGEVETDYYETTNYWPALSKRNVPEWIGKLGAISDDKAPLSDSLSELYGALDQDLNTLAAIGIRTSFDIASELLGCAPSLAFGAKLDRLVELGHIGALDRERLATLVDAGSASAHRGWKPSQDDVETMVDVLEHFIHAAFVAPEEKLRLDERVAAMKSKVPRRAKAASAKKEAEL